MLAERVDRYLIEMRAVLRSMDGGRDTLSFFFFFTH